MRVASSVVGLTLIALGIVAIVDTNLWDNWQWIAAGGAVALGVAGLTSAVRTRPDQDRSRSLR